MDRAETNDEQATLWNEVTTASIAHVEMVPRLLRVQP